MKTAIAVVLSIIAPTALSLSGCTKQLTQESLASENVPAIKKDCAVCHTGHAFSGKTAALKKPVQELCIECHADRAAPNDHKTGVTPAVSVTSLPLLDGKVVCTTCHDPHRGIYRKMLRAPQKDLCLYCHDK